MMAKKTANQKLLEVYEKEIFDAEQKLKDSQETLDDLKELRNDLLKNMAEEESATVSGTVIIQGLPGGLDYNG